MSKPGRPGARKSTKKGATKGSGGQGRKSLEGKGPTPKAEDRSWHVAGKRKAAQERYAAAGGTGRSQRARDLERHQHHRAGRSSGSALLAVANRTNRCVAHRTHSCVANRAHCGVAHRRVAYG